MPTQRRQRRDSSKLTSDAARSSALRFRSIGGAVDAAETATVGTLIARAPAAARPPGRPHALVDDRVAEAVDASRERDDFELRGGGLAHAREGRPDARRSWPQRSCGSAGTARAEGDGVLDVVRADVREHAQLRHQRRQELHVIEERASRHAKQMPLAMQLWPQQATRPSRGGTGRSAWCGSPGLVPSSTGKCPRRTSGGWRAVNSAGASSRWRQTAEGSAQTRRRRTGRVSR